MNMAAINLHSFYVSETHAANQRWLLRGGGYRYITPGKEKRFSQFFAVRSPFVPSGQLVSLCNC
jgi:hypothetical protein